MTEKDSNLPSEEKKRSSFFKIFFWTVSGLFILLLLTGIFFSSVLFAPWEEIPPQYPGSKDFSLQYKLLQKIRRDFFDSKQLYSKKTLSLTPEEINSLFRTAANIKPTQAPYPLRYFRPNLNDNGEFSLVVPFRTSMEWLWGGTIYLKVVFTLFKSEGRDLAIDVKSIQATSYSLPRSLIKKSVDRVMADSQVRNKLDDINKALQALYFKDGKLVIEYIPAQLMQIML